MWGHYFKGARVGFWIAAFLTAFYIFAGSLS